MEQLPPVIYYAIGILFMANIGGIVKLIWFLSKLDSRVSEAKSSAVRSHKRIDVVETKLEELR